jgi:hypothetical protein
MSMRTRYARASAFVNVHLVWVEELFTNSAQMHDEATEELAEGWTADGYPAAEIKKDYSTSGWNGVLLARIRRNSTRRPKSL